MKLPSKLSLTNFAQAIYHFFIGFTTFSFSRLQFRHYGHLWLEWRDGLGGCQEVLPDGAWAWATVSEVCCGKSLFCDGCFLSQGKKAVVVAAG